MLTSVTSKHCDRCGKKRDYVDVTGVCRICVQNREYTTKWLKKFKRRKAAQKGWVTRRLRETSERELINGAV